MTDISDLIERLRSGVIEWCRITHQGHVTDNTPYEAADALEAQLEKRWEEQGQYMRQMDKLEEELRDAKADREDTSR